MDVRLFSRVEELMDLTYLTRKELWDNGFDLDDWNCGMAIPTPLVDKFNDEYWPMINAMDGWCCGLQWVEYNGWTYIMMYHA